MKRLESQHQIAYFQWARRHPVAKRAYAVPNGGQRSKITASILKAEGVRAGVPDVCLPVARGQCHALYIEFKHGPGRLSPAQAEVINELVADGHLVVVAYDWPTAKRWTEFYLSDNPTPSMVIDRGRG